MNGQSVAGFAKEREIAWLFHFTRLSNLDSILRQGLLPRSSLQGAASEVTFNDDLRLDLTDAVCASIGFPNYKMFYQLRKKHPDVAWVIVYIRAKALWELKCAFCHTNAASVASRDISLHERMQPSALERMYAEAEGKSRASMKLSSDLPTDPQAEVLFLEGVPLAYLAGVIVDSISAKTSLLEKYGQSTKVLYNPDYFKYRIDYEHWKPAHTDG